MHILYRVYGVAAIWYFIASHAFSQEGGHIGLGTPWLRFLVLRPFCFTRTAKVEIEENPCPLVPVFFEWSVFFLYI